MAAYSSHGWCSLGTRSITAWTTSKPRWRYLWLASCSQTKDEKAAQGHQARHHHRTSLGSLEQSEVARALPQRCFDKYDRSRRCWSSQRQGRRRGCQEGAKGPDPCPGQDALCSSSMNAVDDMCIEWKWKKTTMMNDHGHFDWLDLPRTALRFCSRARLFADPRPTITLCIGTVVYPGAHS